MRKSQYLYYLNQYSKNRMPSQFRLPKKEKVKGNSQKTKKPPLSQLKHNIQPQKVIHLQDKENFNPNIYHQTFQALQKNQILPRHYKNNDSSAKLKKALQLKISLRSCNFQPSHKCQQLYLIQLNQNEHLIVCEKCAEKFANKTKISSFRSKQQKGYSYVELVQQLKKLEQKKQKLQTIQCCLKKNTQSKFSEISSYFNGIKERINQIRTQIQLSLYRTQKNNLNQLNQVRNQCELYIELVQKSILQEEKVCQDKNHIKTKDIGEKFRQIRRFNSETLNIEITDPQILLPAFDIFFKEQQNQSTIPGVQSSSKMCNFIQSSGQFTDTNEKHDNQSANYFQKIQYQKPQSPKHDSQQKQQNTPSDKAEIRLISSSQQLLISSVRNSSQSGQQRQSDRESVQKLQRKIYQKLSLKPQLRTEASTCRANQEEKNIPRRYSSVNKDNFVKNLHKIDYSQIEDLLCDEELNTESLHPIHKLSQKKNYTNQIQAKDTQRNQHSSPKGKNYPKNGHAQNQQNPTFLTSCSLVINNPNTNDISFQMDDNFIIADGMLLQSPEKQNYDIISPAFKII